jgi:RimJ/RimL family protein N-acetyltransferase
MNVPTLETERLRLRAHRADDLADCAAMWGDPVTTRYLAAQPLTCEEVWARLQRYAGHWSLMGYGFWAVEEKSSGAFAGDVGVAEFRREIEPRLEQPEAGWILARGVHGRGYATEAVRAAMAWAERHFGSARLVCLIHPDNAASLRVAAKCGFREVRRAVYKNHETIVLER